MLKQSRWNLLKNIVLGTGLNENEHTDSKPSPADGGKTDKNEASCEKLTSKSLLARKRSNSDGALNTKQQLIRDIPQVVRKSQECVTQSKDNNNHNNGTHFNNFNKAKGKGAEGSKKVPVIMSRFLRSSSQRKRRKGGFIQRILSNDDVFDEDDAYLLRHAVRESDTKRVLELLANGNIDIDDAGENGITALHEAAIDGNLICMTILITYGAKINGCDCEGFTPLDYTVFGGNFECASYLIENGAKEDRIRDGQIIYQENVLKTRPRKSATF